MTRDEKIRSSELGGAGDRRARIRSFRSYWRGRRSCEGRWPTAREPFPRLLWGRSRKRAASPAASKKDLAAAGPYTPGDIFPRAEGEKKNEELEGGLEEGDGEDIERWRD